MNYRTNYRTSTYVAFDGNGTTDPTKGDLKYLGLLRLWNESPRYEFSFSDSHKKTYQVKDSSSIETLKARLCERLKLSKNMLVIISDDTNYDRGLLNYEIEKAVDKYKIPLIVAYTGYEYIMKPAELEDKWPKALKERIREETANCIHIPFKQAPIFDAINQFTVQKNNLKGSLNYYTRDTYIYWGIIK